MIKNPIQRFQNALKRAQKKGIPLANAMALATASKSGKPSARMMLLKGADERGFIFYTNLKSRKAKELFINRRGSIVFWWPKLEEQIRVEGKIKSVSSKEADLYYATRPRGSQIGAWASHQSAVLMSRRELLRAVREFENKFKGRKVTRPSFWSGFILVPQSIEFWHGMPDRLHKREIYFRTKRGWTLRYLCP